MATDIETLDSRIVHRWLGGCLPNSIARALRVPPTQVREVLGRFAEQAIPKDRQIATARQLGRLDELIVEYWPLAKSGNYKALHAVLKMIMHQNLLLGICQPNSAHANTIAVQVNNIERRQDSTSRIEEALRRLVEDQRREQRAEPIEADANPVKAEAGTE